MHDLPPDVPDALPAEPEAAPAEVLVEVPDVPVALEEELLVAQEAAVDLVAAEVLEEVVAVLVVKADSCLPSFRSKRSQSSLDLSDLKVLSI